MAKELGAGMTPDQMRKEAERLFLEAALTMTRLDRKMKKAVRLVLINGHTLTEAARLVARPRQNVYRAVNRVRPLIATVKEESAK